MRQKWVVAGWASAAAVAVAAGVGAVALAQGGTLDPASEPMTQEEALRELEQAQSATPGASSSPEVSPTPTGELETAPSGEAGAHEQVIAVDGGTVMARCGADGRIELVWWSAAQGWRISSVDPGPDEDAEIEFEGDSDDDGEAEYTIACVDGSPKAGAHADGGDDADD